MKELGWEFRNSIQNDPESIAPKGHHEKKGQNVVESHLPNCLLRIGWRSFVHLM